MTNTRQQIFNEFLDCAGINNAGQIVGHYLIEDDAGDFEQRAFVATAVAE